MALFGVARQARRDDKDLGKGIWRRAHDRFRRAVERYHQVLEGVQDDGLYDELLPIANQVAGLLPRVRTCCAAAQSMHPTDGLDIPGGPLAEVHRNLSKAGNSLAATAQAAAMARLGGSQTPTILSSPRSGRRRLVRILAPTSVSPYFSIGLAALAS